jgi:hypothetical protein
MQPETVTAITGGVITLVLAIARLVAQHVRKKPKKVDPRALEEIRARKMPDARAAAEAAELCARVVLSAKVAVKQREPVALEKTELASLMATYEKMLRRTPRAKLAPYVERTLPLFFLACYYALTSVGAAEIETFRAAARRLHLPDAVCVLARIGATHVPIRIEPRGSLRPLVEGAALEDQLCPSHAEENEAALATVRDWTSNDRDPRPVTVRPAYATALTAHLLRADEAACVVCVARDRDDALGPVLRAVYRNEHTLAVRVEGNVVTAACAAPHSGELVANAVGAAIDDVLTDGPAWNSRACTVTRLCVGARSFIFVTIK